MVRRVALPLLELTALVLTALVLAALAPAAAVPAQELVSFPTEDGGTVFADLYDAGDDAGDGAGERGVVLAHGGRFDKESWAKQAKVLARAGFRVLAIDFRGYGRSRAGSETTAKDAGLRFDVLAAVRYLRAKGAKSVAAVGASMGGGAVAEAAVAAKPGEIERLVLLAAVPIAEPQRLSGRKLFVVCRDDAGGDGRPRLPGIQAQFERAPEPKQLLVLDCEEHAQFIFETARGEALLRTIVEFLSN